MGSHGILGPFAAPQTSPNYLRIAEELKKAILDNVLAPGSRIDSHQALSERFGVSRVTIRQALTLLQKQGYVNLIPKKGSFVSHNAVRLSRVRFHLVALLIESIQDPFFNEVTQCLERALLRKNLHIVLCDTAGESRETNYIELLRDRVDGFIIGPSLHEKSWAQYRNLSSLGIPVVLFDRDIRNIIGDRVLVDNYLGGRIAAEHLLELGHTRFATLTYTWPRRALLTPAENLVLRVRGFCDRLLEAGILPADISSLNGEGGRTKAAGAEAARQWLALDPLPTALFATNDLLCLGAMEVAAQSGLSAPKDYSIVGFDDINLVGWLNIPLTTVAQPKEELANQITRLLTDQLDGRQRGHSQHVLLHPTLMVRRSTGAPPAPELT